MYTDGLKTLSPLFQCNTYVKECTLQHLMHLIVFKFHMSVPTSYWFYGSINDFFFKANGYHLNGKLDVIFLFLYVI